MNQALVTTLQDVGIADLRVIGRLIGVASPTTLNRKELISRILAIADGSLRPTAPSMKGKPVKHVSLSDELYELVEEIQRQNRLHTDYDLSHHSVKLSDSSSPLLGFSDAKTTEGYVLRLDERHWCLFGDDFKIRADLSDSSIARYGVRDGMFAKVRTDSFGAKFVSIERIPADRFYPTTPWEDSASVVPGTLGNVAKCFSIPKGSLVAAIGDRADELISGAIEDRNAYIFAVCADGREPKNGFRPYGNFCEEELPRNKDAETFVRWIGARATVTAETGATVLLVARCADGQIGLFEPWFGLRKQIVNGGSVTVVLTTADEVPDAEIVLDTRGMEDVFPPVDLTRSTTRYPTFETETMRRVTQGLTPMEAWTAWRDYWAGN